MSKMTLTKYNVFCENYSRKDKGREMQIHHIRNATMIIESFDKFILVDPMLSDKGELPSFSNFRHKSQKNPIVELPQNSNEILEKVTHCLITHSHTFGLKALQHTDHLDAKGEEFLSSKNIPIVSRDGDEKYLKRYGLNVVASVKNWESKNFLGGKITAVPALHGHGWISKMMANGVGFFLELPNEPSIYISGDTVYTPDVERALKSLDPDITVVASGSATVDVGDSILMPVEEIIKFVKNSPKKVIANHMEALNHCPTTREALKEVLTKENLLEKVFIPKDGETIGIR